ncbi:MAG: PAS domain S-box protein [candidate division NC10 bacterium]|nr:PAS domain S-box protein [candidate division NC10 bacterium]
MIPSPPNPTLQSPVLQAALESAGNAIIITHREGRIIWVNPAFTRLTGYTTEEVLGQNPRLLNSGKQDRSFYQHLWETILSGQVWHGEMINRRKDGSLYTEEQTITPVCDERGDITYFIAIKQDITERKHAEKMLQESEERYRDLVENSEDLVCTHDLEGTFLSVNRALVRRFGYERPEDIVGRKISDFLAPDTSHLFADYLETIMKEGRAHGLMKILTRDGEKRIIEYQNSIRSERVETPVVRSISHDVTERERADAALRKSKKRYSDLVENANDIIYTYDLAGNFTSLNQAGERITGYSRNETPTMKLAQVIAPEYLDLSRQMLARKLTEGGPTTYELEIIRKDGRRVPLEVSNLLIYEHGRPVGVQGIARDITERKQAEEALRETHDMLTAVIQASPMGITILDTDGNVKLWNPAAERIFGWRQDEVLGRPLPTIPYDKHEEHRALRERVLRNEAFAGIEIARQRKDGSAIDISLSTAPLRNVTGNIWGAMGIMVDIGERKRAEEGRARLSAILEVTTDFVGIADIHGKAIYLNNSGRKMLGIEEDEDFANRDIADTHPEWAKRIILDEGIPAAIRDGVWSGETAFLSRDGREIPVSQVILAHKAPDGTVQFLSTIARDITERKREAATRHALYQASLQIQEPLGLQERLDRLLQTAQTVLALDRINILLADPAGQWLEAVASLGVEEPLEAILVPIGPAGGALAEAYRSQKSLLWEGRSPVPEELRLQPPYDRIAALRSRVFAIVPLVVQGRAIGVLGVDRKHSRRPLEPATLEFLQLFAAQTAIAIENSRLYEAQRKAAIQLEAAVEDRTQELKAANVRLEEASRHKSRFLANMSHELRTPLNSVIGFSQLLQDQTLGALSEKQGRYVANIETSGQHLLTLINDLLDLSKVEAGKLELRPEPLNFADVLEASLASIRPQAEVKGQTLHLNFESVLPPLTADPVRLKQILFNLLSNAVKFTPDAGRVLVTARGVSSAEFGVRSGVDSTSHVARRTLASSSRSPWPTPGSGSRPRTCPASSRSSCSSRPRGPSMPRGVASGSP